MPDGWRIYNASQATRDGVYVSAVPDATGTRVGLAVDRDRRRYRQLGTVATLEEAIAFFERLP